MNRQALCGAVALMLSGLTIALLVTGCGQSGASYARHPSGVVQQSASYPSTAARSAPAGSLPSLDEEVWVIVRPETAAETTTRDDLPGCGAMMCRLPESLEPVDVPLPLRHTDVQASISAYIASVKVTQQFYNPYDGKIEAVYVFPLPQNAAVTGFVMTVGERRIRGIIREREEAERIYNEAKHQGYVASLLTQERANIFTQHVANIEPGNQIDVDITYFYTLAYDDGWYEFVFPMVVGPRFNPPGFTDGVGAVARGANGTSGQATEVQYLRPHERSGHDISLRVTINAGVPIEEIRCTSHRIDTSKQASEEVRVALAPDDRIPNKDFVLRYRVAGDQLKTALLTHHDERGGFFAFMLYPPQDLSALPRQPMEMIFVLDCSGSMSGEPMKQVRDAVDHALTQLLPQDTFQIVRFSNAASQWSANPVSATTSQVAKGRQYVGSLHASGGTMMITGIRAALDPSYDSERLRFVTFLTDGYIGNEAEILGEIHDRLGASRIFSFGVGSSPNRYLLQRMGKIGQGAVAYLALNDDGAEVMDHFFERISHPVLTDIEIDWGGMEVEDVIPSRVPDLFVGRPVVVTGRFDGAAPTTVRVQGRAGGELVAASFEIDLSRTDDTHEALPAVWARQYIAQLVDQATYDPDLELPQQIEAIALQYGLMSAYTSFVAVDSKTRTQGVYGTTVHVAVPVPQGVRYETTVQESDPR